MRTWTEIPCDIYIEHSIYSCRLYTEDHNIEIAIFEHYGISILITEENTLKHVSYYMKLFIKNIIKFENNNEI